MECSISRLDSIGTGFLSVVNRYRLRSGLRSYEERSYVRRRLTFCCLLRGRVCCVDCRLPHADAAADAILRAGHASRVEREELSYVRSSLYGNDGAATDINQKCCLIVPEGSI